LDRESAAEPAADRLPEAALPLVRVLLDCLPPREGLVVRARFGLLPDRPECTLQEVGSLLGVSKERARQLLTRAFVQLRSLADESRFADLQAFAGSDERA
jgi:DNA-directed RNA polymerase sigma subunit (sigma70/sigma32)